MKTKEELQEMAQLVRIHEANCQVMHPSADEAAFRLAIMKKLALELNLKELRGARLPEAATGAPNTKPRREANG
jgi:hypothetical protein